MLDTLDKSASRLARGNLTVTALSDGYLDIPAAYFSNVTQTEQDAVSPSTRFGANTWLIETGTRKILVDAGSGEYLKERFPASGTLTWQAPEKTEERAAVTDIVITHMHADHIGGLSLNGSCGFIVAMPTSAMASPCFQRPATPLVIRPCTFLQATRKPFCSRMSWCPMRCNLPIRMSVMRSTATRIWP